MVWWSSALYCDSDTAAIDSIRWRGVYDRKGISAAYSGRGKCCISRSVSYFDSIFPFGQGLKNTIKRRYGDRIGDIRIRRAAYDREGIRASTTGCAHGDGPIIEADRWGRGAIGDHKCLTASADRC